MSKSEIKKRAPTLYVIIVLKLLKGVVLLALAFGVYRMIGRNLGANFDDLLRWLHLDPERKFFADLGEKLQSITPGNLRWLARGTLLYCLFSLVEGIGLIFRVSWAGWLAIGESAFFVPIEAYELTRNFSATVLCVLVINVVIVWYLFQNRERLFRHH
ncbi:MAG: DUF2127 domain-containing protein [Verrucomicrobiota bacterium]